MPTLIGWAGASGTITRGGWFLFALLFLWQFPHFLAIALMYRDDYSRAGFHMLPGFDLEGRFTHAKILAFTVALVAATLLPGFALSQGWLYFVSHGTRRSVLSILRSQAGCLWYEGFRQPPAARVGYLSARHTRGVGGREVIYRVRLRGIPLARGE